MKRTLGDGVRGWRRRRKWTLEDLARKTGLGIAYLSKLERGGINATANTFGRIADALGVKIGDLFLIGEAESDLGRPIGDAPAEHQIKMVEGGVCAVRLAPLDPQNALPSSLQYFDQAQREKSDRILLYPHTINLSAAQAYRTVRAGAEWLRSQEYRPQIALISDREVERFGMEVARDLGFDAACYPTEAEAIRWLHKRRGS